MSRSTHRRAAAVLSALAIATSGLVVSTAAGSTSAGWCCRLGVTSVVTR